MVTYKIKFHLPLYEFEIGLYANELQKVVKYQIPINNLVYQVDSNFPENKVIQTTSYCIATPHVAVAASFVCAVSYYIISYHNIL